MKTGKMDLTHSFTISLKTKTKTNKQKKNRNTCIVILKWIHTEMLENVLVSISSMINFGRNNPHKQTFFGILNNVFQLYWGVIKG